MSSFDAATPHFDELQIARQCDGRFGSVPYSQYIVVPTSERAAKANRLDAQSLYSAIQFV
jgi:hypothetical protein